MIEANYASSQELSGGEMETFWRAKFAVATRLVSIVLAVRIIVTRYATDTANVAPPM